MGRISTGLAVAWSRDQADHGPANDCASSQPKRRRSDRLMLLAAVGAAAALALSRPAFVELGAGWLLAAAALIGLVPAWLFVTGRSFSPYPFIALAGAFYALFFALPPFVIERGWWSEGFASGDAGYGVRFTAITTFTGALVLLGVAALIASYHVVAVLLRRRDHAVAPPQRQPAMVIGAMYLIALGHVAFLFVPELRASSSLAQAMMPLGYLALGTLFLAWLRRELPRPLAAGLVLVIVPATVFAACDNRLITPAILLVLFLGTVFWHARRRLLPCIVAGAVCVLVVFPLLKFVDPAVFLPKAASDPASHQSPVVQIVRRAALVVTLQYVTDLTPARIPYWHGATLQNLATNAMPRVLWPDKPREELGQWFGHTYRMLNPDDADTSMNLPWLVELYINFGIAGVGIGMALIGALMALLERLLLASRHELRALAGWSLLFPLTYQASNLSMMLGGLPTQIVFVLAVTAAIIMSARVSLWVPSVRTAE